MFLFLGYGDHRELHVRTPSLPTRRSSVLRFMRAVAAICVRGQTILLPSIATPDAIADLQLRYPDSCVLRDAQIDDSVIAPATAVPSIAADHPAAMLFTSGSTGVPQEIGRAHV